MRFIQMLGVMAVMAIAACGDGSVTATIEYGPCEEDTDCPGLSDCVDGICVQEVEVTVPCEGESESEAEAEGEEFNCTDTYSECVCGCVDDTTTTCRDLGWSEECDTIADTCERFVCEVEECVSTGEETCNYRDDDCDGEIDEGFNKGGECYRGEGECRVYGITACDPDGGTFCVADDTVIPEPVEICGNGRDDDCDGQLDCGTFDCGPCPPACTSVIIDGEEITVEGAPFFGLHADTPSGEFIPAGDSVEIMRFVMGGICDDGCDSALELRNLPLQATYTDIGGVGWMPDHLVLIRADTDVVLGTAYGVHVIGSDPLRTVFDIRLDYVVEPCETIPVSAYLMLGRLPTPTSGDVLQAGMVGEVEYVTMDYGTVYAPSYAMFGNTLEIP